MFWLYEYVYFFLIWNKLKKKSIIIPSNKYNIGTDRTTVNIADISIRVNTLDINGVILIYPFNLVYDKPINVLFYKYKSLYN